MKDAAQLLQRVNCQSTINIQDTAMTTGNAEENQQTNCSVA